MPEEEVEADHQLVLPQQEQQNHYHRFSFVSHFVVITLMAW